LAEGFFTDGPSFATFEASERFVKNFLPKDDSSLVWPMLGPHAEYSVDLETLKESAELSRELGIRIHMHFAEELDKKRETEKKLGQPLLELVDKNGFLDDRLTLVHCVHLTTDEINLLGNRKVNIVHCPTSNVKLGISPSQGVAQVSRMASAGCPVGLGTDGAPVNNDLSILGEMQMAGLLHKGSSGDPTAMQSKFLLKMATTEGARTMGMESLIGSLEVGKRADIAVFDLFSSRMTPPHDPAAMLCYSASVADVKATICNGRIVFENGIIRTVNEESILQEARAAAARLREDIILE